MALLVVFGVMNVTAMVVLALVVLVEKLSKWGKVFSRLVGSLSIALAVAVIWIPALAGLEASPMAHIGLTAADRLRGMDDPAGLTHPSRPVEYDIVSRRRGP